MVRPHFTGLLFLLLFSCQWLGPEPARECSPLQVPPRLKLINVQLASSCTASDGGFVVEAFAGVPPYRFQIVNEQNNVNGRFGNLRAGDYTVKVFDLNNCSSAFQVRVGAAKSTFDVQATTSPDNKCFSDNGMITVKAVRGKRPYLYQFQDGPFAPDSVFDQLSDGYYRVSARDAEGCAYAVRAHVRHGFTGVSYVKDVQPIILGKCAFSGCHNGDNGFNINFTVFNNVRFYSSVINNMVSLKRIHYAQPPLNDQEIRYISCWVKDGSLNN
jgi:hypothetical protein